MYILLLFYQYRVLVTRVLVICEKAKKMSESDVSSSGEAKYIKKRKTSVKKKFTHKFRREWMIDDDLEPWLTESIRGDTYFYCKFCNSDYLGGISAVKKHGNSEKHKSVSSSIKNIITLDKMRTVQSASEIAVKRKEAEIRLAMFIVEHNIALRTSDHLVYFVVSLLKTICPESDVIRNISCNRTKATAIVCNVIGEYSSMNLTDRMKNNLFSIMIDESTDHSNTKHLVIVTRMMNNETYEVRDEFAGLVQVSDGTAQGLYDTIIMFFNKNNINYKKNLVGFASDGANVMFGNHHSVKSLLEHDVPNIFVMKCLCHSLALCASYACEKIPSDVEELLRDIYSYMKYSFKNFNILLT